MCRHSQKKNMGHDEAVVTQSSVKAPSPPKVITNIQCDRCISHRFCDLPLPGLKNVYMYKVGDCTKLQMTKSITNALFVVNST